MPSLKSKKYSAELCKSISVEFFGHGILNMQKHAICKSQFTYCVLFIIPWLL